MDSRLFGNRIPLYEREGFIICFEAQEDDESAYHHFVITCGWTKKEFEEIENYPFFTACISAWRDGEELGAAYLAACCYRTVSEFYREYKEDYLEDMTTEAIEEAKKAEAARSSKAEIH